MKLFNRFRSDTKSILNFSEDPVLSTAIDYERQLRSTRAAQNPIIVIPGILGSNITDSKTDNPVWGDFAKSFTNIKSDQYLQLVSLPMEQGKTLDQLVGTSSSDGSMRYMKGSIAGLPININTYASMMSAMGVGGGGLGSSLEKLDDFIDDKRHEANAFEFDYDWRRSIDENAIRLGKYIQLITRFVQLQRGNHYLVKFDIVAHSMGCLITRYYLQYGSQLLPAGKTLPVQNWSGSAQIERAVFIAPPNAGSLFSLESLLAGIKKNPLTPQYDPVILGTLPAVYQLLPRIRHKTFVRSDGSGETCNFFNTGFWVDMNWGLADTSKDDLLCRLLPGIESASERRDIALDHLQKCLFTTEKLQKALDTVSTCPAHLQMFLFVGDTKKTPLIATAKKGDKKLTYLKKGAGDGTVPRFSALQDERIGGKAGARVISPLRWKNICFLSSSHLGLTKDPICIKNILYILLERPEEQNG